MSKKNLSVKKEDGEEKKTYVLMNGLNNVLKSKILAKMVDEEDFPTKLDILDNSICVNGINLNVWEVNGKNKAESLDDNWKKCLRGAKALIYVFDTSDKDKRVEESFTLAEKLLKFKEFEKYPVLIFCNKFDINRQHCWSQSRTYFGNLIEKRLGKLLKTRSHRHFFCNTNSETDIGAYEEGFDWLTREFLENNLFASGEENERNRLKPRVVMAGLKKAGKSTILQTMSKYRVARRIEDFKVEEIKCTVWDVTSEQLKIPESICRFPHFLALICVIDSRINVEQSLDDLKAFLNTEQLKNLPLLVFYNKAGNKDNQDKKRFLSIDHFKEYFFTKTLKKELESINYNYYIHEFTAVTYEGLFFGFQMLKTLLEKQKPEGKSVKSKKQFEEIRVVMTGLAAVGKSTILSKLAKHDIIRKDYRMVPVKEGATIYNLWLVRDIATGKEVLKDTEVLIFVVDSAVDATEALEKLQKLLKKKSCVSCPLLIFLNKTDLPKSIDKKSFELSMLKTLGRELKNRPYHIAPCNATNNQGLQAGFEKLKPLMKKKGENVGSKYFENSI